MNDDDWELFVPVIGEEYPIPYQYRYRTSKGWSDWCCGACTYIENPRNDCCEYRKPKQKETKMPDRTPQQALRDAIVSGAVEAWINGEEIQCDLEGDWKDYEVRAGLTPNFQHSEINWKPKPPEPTRINWQPVVTGKEPKGVVLGTWEATVQSCYCKDGKWYRTVDGTSVAVPWSWAPMCNLPEGDK